MSKNRKPHKVKNRTLAVVREPVFRQRIVEAKKGKKAQYKRNPKHKNYDWDFSFLYL